MKLIPLTQGKFATVDDGDFEFLNKWKWYAFKSGKTWYAGRMPLATEASKNRSRVLLHRALLAPLPGQEIDHINFDGLDNRRSNIRVCSKAQNHRNRPKNSNNKSGYKGVHWFAQCGKWKAQIGRNGVVHYLGLFETLEDAAKAYDEAAKKFYGEFACTNGL